MTSQASAQQNESSSRAEPWNAFVASRKPQAYFRAWLEIVCVQFPEVRAGALLLQDDEGQSLLPVAVWPNDSADLSRLAPSIQKAIAEKRGLTELVATAPEDATPVTRIAYPVIVDDCAVGAVSLETLPNPLRAQQILRHLHWGLGWIVESLQRRQTLQSTEQAARTLSVLESVATALRPGKLREILFEVANDVSRKLECARVGIGLVDQETVHLTALSDAAWIERSTPLSKSYAAAMEEAYDARAIVVSLVSSSDVDKGAATEFYQLHARLRQENGARAVASIPLNIGIRCIGVITLEWHGERDCTPSDLLWLQAFAAMLPSIVEDKRQAQQGFTAKAVESVKAVLSRIFGPKHLTWKVGTALTAATVAAMVLIPVDYRVSAKTVIEGETQRVVAAPFEGFIASATTRAGDTVKQGQVVAQLEDRDLKAELAKWTSERDQYERKSREAMAAHEMSSLQITQAQLRQAEAQVKLFGDRLQRATITAPHDGIVVSGDLSQLIGSPVEQGKKLFEIAPLESYRVILQVDEKEIRHVTTGQQGELLVAGIAGDPLGFTVTKVTPVATAQDGKNFFRVEAKLHESSPRLRPGMEGIGKIRTDEQRLWTALTRNFTHWLRLTLWNWMP